MKQIKQEKLKKGGYAYLISGLGFLLAVLLLAATVYFREEIRHLDGYGYLGVFIVGVLCGVTIIPAPTLLLVFAFGNILNPAYVGLVAGLGGAAGGITVYLTGAGVETMWSRFWHKKRASEHQSSQRYDIVGPVQSKFWSRGEAFYRRLVKRIGGKGGYWVLFLTSAMIISPFYFAGLAAGSLRMGLLRFFLISWAGKTVRYLIVAFAGHWGLYFLLKWIGA
ncbi:VTT domain-containing protein [Chloroflexota bacterium]